MARLVKWLNNPYLQLVQTQQGPQYRVNHGGTVTLDMDRVVGIQEIYKPDTSQLDEFAFLVDGLPGPMVFSGPHADIARSVWIEYGTTPDVIPPQDKPAPQPHIYEEAQAKNAELQNNGKKLIQPVSHKI